VGETNSFASLSPRLLARKGGAKPAMRRQVEPIGDCPVELAAITQEDLGWNDMGADAQHQPAIAEVVELGRAAGSRKVAPPRIVAQQNELAERVESRPKADLRAAGRRAAFTLRIDAERHLQLRLASTVSGRSAQSLLTDALDRMLDEMPDIRSLAKNVRKRS
jgi:hypothetical protein